MAWADHDVRRVVEVGFKRPVDGSRPSCRHEVVRFFRDFNHRTHSGLGSWSDPIPAFAENLYLVRELAWGASKRLVRRIAPKAFERAASLRSIGYAATVAHGKQELARAIGRNRRFE